MINEVKDKLEDFGIPYHKKDDGILIKIPNDFGELEFYELPDNDDILLLANEDWHTHSSTMGGVEEIAELIRDIILGKYLLIKETSGTGVVTRRIEENMEEYLKWLPQEYSYEVCNKA